jgi:hypothetical protein
MARYATLDERELPQLVELASQLDPRQVYTLSWVGFALYYGLLENV